MFRPLAALVPSLLALAFLLPAPRTAEAEGVTHPRTLGFPDVGLSLVVPPDWKIAQHGPAVVKVSKAGASLWFYDAENDPEDIGRHLRRAAAQAARDNPDAPAPSPARWKVKGAEAAQMLWFTSDGRMRFHGVIHRAGGAGFHAEGDLPAKATETRKAFDRILASVDVRPYKHPARLVDWNRSLTIDAAKGWQVKEEKDGRLRLLPDEGQGSVSVTAQGETVAAASPAARMAGLLQAGRKRLGSNPNRISLALEGEIESFDFAHGTKGHRQAYTAKLAGKPFMRGHLHIIRGFAVNTMWPEGDAATAKRIQALVRTFAPGMHCGPRIDPKPADPKKAVAPKKPEAPKETGAPGR